MRTDASASDRASISLLLDRGPKSTAKNHGLPAKLGLRFLVKPECHRPRLRSVSLAAVCRHIRTGKEVSMGKTFDVIVMGARCAGSPTAMLLARRGHRVLAVDRASFPSDTISTHLVHPRAVNALSRWGLLEGLVATGCPPIHTYAFDFGAFTIAGAPGMDKHPVAYCPRRTILDKLLVDAAADPARKFSGFRRRGNHDRERTRRRHQGPVEARRRHGICRHYRGSRRPALPAGRGTRFSPSTTARSRP